MQANDRSAMAAEHRFQRLALEAGDVRQDTCRREMRSDLGRHLGGEVNRHRQQAEINVLREGADVRPILAVQNADVVVRPPQPVGEEAAHLAAPADDEDLGPGPDAAAPERVQLPHARMTEHRAEQVLDVVRVQPGLGGLGAAGGDEILLTSGVEGGQFVLLFDLGDLLDDLESLGQQLHQLPVNGVNLHAQLLQARLWGRAGRSRLRGWARLAGGLLIALASWVCWNGHRGQRECARGKRQGRRGGWRQLATEAETAQASFSWRSAGAR